MSIPLPPVSGPRALWQDLRLFLSSRSRYQWIGAVAAVVMPAAILVMFYLDGQHSSLSKQKVIYVESWPENRSSEEIKAAQKARQERRRAEALEKQRQYKELGRRLGM